MLEASGKCVSRLQKHLNFSRYIYTTCIFQKQIPKNLKGKSKSSQEWLLRQLSDPYIDKAKMLNYRCRSAFKLLEIDDKYKILRPGNVVIDCGAAPGSWTQVAVNRTNANDSMSNTAKGAVFSIDYLNFHPVMGSTMFCGMDFRDKKSQENLKKAINGRPVNCILSDMAPNATGYRALDQENIISLCYSVLRFALSTSSLGAHLLVKVWDSNAVAKLEEDMSGFYEKVKRIKPKSSRSDSSELFILAKSLRSLSRPAIDSST